MSETTSIPQTTAQPAEIPVVDHSHLAEQINESINYALYAAFTETGDGSVADPAAAAAGITAALAAVPNLTVRGFYDISGFRGDADLFVWMHGPTPETVQAGYRAIVEGAKTALQPFWSNIGVHRAAEFNRGHVPAFLAGDKARDYLCVYPFVRSREWYLLPEEERRKMLRDHGYAARDYRDVLANTLASFALGDYEWLLAFESDNLIRIVDLMRELRATDARRHVIEETPFFTGPRVAGEALLQRAFQR